MSAATIADAEAVMLGWLTGGEATARQLSRCAGVDLKTAAAIIGDLERDGRLVADRTCIPTRWALRPGVTPGGTP